MLCGCGQGLQAARELQPKSPRQDKRQKHGQDAAQRKHPVEQVELRLETLPAAHLYLLLCRDKTRPQRFVIFGQVLSCVGRAKRCGGATVACGEVRDVAFDVVDHQRGFAGKQRCAPFLIRVISRQVLQPGRDGHRRRSIAPDRSKVSRSVRRKITLRILLDP